MNIRVIELEASVHQKVQKLLPWAVLDKLHEGERKLVDEHCAMCAQCRDDLAWQRKLQSVQPAAGASPDMEASLARLLPQLEPRQGAQGAGWMRWALAAQLLLIAGLSARLLVPADEFQLLGANAADGANLVVVFRSETSEGRLRALLRANGAKVVDGPTEANAWLLKVEAPRLPAALAAMRADGAVELAEPLQAGGPK